MSVKPLKTGMKFFQLDRKKKKVVKEGVDIQSVNQTKNLDINNLFSMLSNKIDSLRNIPMNIYGENNQSKTLNVGVVDVDIQRAIAIGKVDKNAVKSEVIEGKVNNKLDKLRKLRKKSL
jgi:hypothetical protein